MCVCCPPCQGLGEVIRVTSAEALKPSVVHITGPLIRNEAFNKNNLKKVVKYVSFFKPDKIKLIYKKIFHDKTS